MSGWIQIVGLIVIPSIALIGLLYYVRATIEQAEAMQKPCLVLDSETRDPRNATILNKANPGDLILAARTDQVALRNIGAGPAVNVRYMMQRVSEPNPGWLSEGSIQTISPKEFRLTHAAAAMFPAQRFECTIIYESLSKRRYETRVFVNDIVLGEFKFRRLGLWARLAHSVRERRRRRKSERLEDIA